MELLTYTIQYIKSNLIGLLDFGEVADLDFVWPVEDCFAMVAREIVFAP